MNPLGKDLGPGLWFRDNGESNENSNGNSDHVVVCRDATNRSKDKMSCEKVDSACQTS